MQVTEIPKNITTRRSLYLYIIGILATALNSYASQYQFDFHHYNDIYSYDQIFSTPSYNNNYLFFDANASQNASKNITLSKSGENSMIKFSLGMRPKHYLMFNLRQSISNNSLKTENTHSNVSKNEFLLEANYEPKDYMKISPYYLILSDQYKRKTQDNLSIDNSGQGKGVKGNLNIRNLGTIGASIEYLKQKISNEKSGILNASFEKGFPEIRIGGNLEAKNTLSQYPILNGKEEKFHESANGNIFSEFSIFGHLTTLVTYEGGYANEIYTLLNGYSGKHNNEKRIFNNFASTLRYPVCSKILLDISIDSYNGEKRYQEAPNDEISAVKTLTPSVTYRPNNNAEIRIERIVRLSSFTFPALTTVTDRDILDKSVLLTSRYKLPGETNIALFLSRTENHIIYLRSEMSANNVCRTKYKVETIVNYLSPRWVDIEESFSLVSNYQIYDFSTNKNLFTRSFTHKSRLTISGFHSIQPLVKYELVKQDWGPYIFSYDTGGYLFYRSIENRKELYQMDIELKPFTSFSLIPSYIIKRNQFINRNNISTGSTNLFIEEHYTLSAHYKKKEGKLIEIEVSRIKKDAGDDFYEIKSSISYGI